MMPAVALVGIPGPRWLPPLPVPLFLLWPIVWICLGFIRRRVRERPQEAERLRTAAQVFHELRGLTVDVDTADGSQIRIRFH